jgi:hypothetical protein
MCVIKKIRTPYLGWEAFGKGCKLPPTPALFLQALLALTSTPNILLNSVSTYGTCLTTEDIIKMLKSSYVQNNRQE